MGCFAVSTYATVSILFWYMGMIPDLAVIRDRAVKRLNREEILLFLDIFRKYFDGLEKCWTTIGEIMKWHIIISWVYLHLWFFLFTQSFHLILP